MLNLRLFHLSLLFVLSACATGGVQVSSVPDEAVVLLAKEGQAPFEIGKTPLSFTSEDHDLRSGQYSHLIVKKEGYQTESVLIPTGMIPKDIRMSVSLDKHEVPISVEMSASQARRDLEDVASGVARVQHLLQQKRYVQAEDAISSLIGRFPDISVLHDLAGNTYYLLGQFDKAVERYQSALRLDPERRETQRMIERIRGIRGERFPSNQESRQ